MATVPSVSAMASKEVLHLPPGMDPGYYALSLLEREKLEECVAFVSQQSLREEANTSEAPEQRRSLNNVLWYAQTKAMLLQHWFDDAAIEDDGVEELLLEAEQTILSSTPCTETSLDATRPCLLTGKVKRASVGTSASRGGGLGTSTQEHHIGSRHGFARVGTSNNRPGSVQARGRLGTAVRPTTARFARVSTAALELCPHGGGPHIQTQLLNFDDFVQKLPMLAKLLCDYLFYVEHKPKLALTLCTAVLRPPAPPPRPYGLPLGPASSPNEEADRISTSAVNDWWWWARLGKANYQLGLLREAERCFRHALYGASSGGKASGSFLIYDTSTIMELGKVYKKMNQPLAALELYHHALESNALDCEILLCIARLHDERHEPTKAYECYRQVLSVDGGNVEALASLAAYLFYEKEQPDQAFALYHRLVQMGVDSMEVWNNLGVCSLGALQLDHAFKCFERALLDCQNEAQRADVWYNIGHVFISTGELRFAEQAFQLAVAADQTHAQALNNLAVLSYVIESRSSSSEVVFGPPTAHLLELALRAAPALVEALYNSALVSYEAKELERAAVMLRRSLNELPDHRESLALRSKLQDLFLDL